MRGGGGGGGCVGVGVGVCGGGTVHTSTRGAPSSPTRHPPTPPPHPPLPLPLGRVHPPAHGCRLPAHLHHPGVAQGGGRPGAAGQGGAQVCACVLEGGGGCRRVVLVGGAIVAHPSTPPHPPTHPPHPTHPPTHPTHPPPHAPPPPLSPLELVEGFRAAAMGASSPMAVARRMAVEEVVRVLMGGSMSALLLEFACVFE